ncbi:MAG: malectin [Pirellulaceae bacterium]|nr:malectin [Pirellulaceae bacterium]
MAGPSSWLSMFCAQLCSREHADTRSYRGWMAVLCASVVCWPAAIGARDVCVDDAFVRSDGDGSRWVVGTDAVEMTVALNGGRLQLMACVNKLTKPARDYMGPGAAVDLLPCQNSVFPDKYRVEQVWSRVLRNGVVADPSADGLRLTVKQGDMIGFALGKRDPVGVEWVTRIDCGDGETYTSSDDTSLAQGPTWFYFVHVGGTGFMEQMSSTEGDGDKKLRRPPSGSYFYPAWSRGPSVNGSTLYSTDYQAVRAWRAPKDGVVTVTGTARVLGAGSAEVRVLRITDGTGSPSTTDSAGQQWRSEKASAERVVVGGRAVAQLTWTLASAGSDGLRVVVHLHAYPGTAILRHWLELKNAGSTAVRPAFFPQVFSLGVHGEDLTHHWMIGGNNADDQGMLKTAEVSRDYHQAVGSHGQWTYMPWMAVQRKSGDGWFAQLDYTGMWRLAVDRDSTGPVRFTASLPEMQFVQGLAPGEQMSLPMVTLGVFRDDLDDMGRRIYDWQYTYLWDYTRHDWFGKMLYAAPIFGMNTGTASNQENFTVRLQHDMVYADIARKAGFDILWDDAGWYAQPGFWNLNREGPDFAQTVRYTTKSGMKWTLWFLNHPAPGLLDTKVGAWGNFQWRTDGVASYALKDEQEFRRSVAGFLDRHPRASFHTCGGGGTYAHTFEIQRYADANYFADFGGDQTNYYCSYFELPDKWFDPLLPNIKEYPGKRQRMLTMVPVWGAGAANGDGTDLRPITDLYRYLMVHGVAGRWSYVAHPAIQGDLEYQYFQRLNRDRTKSVIILRHQPKGAVTICPRGLIAEQDYAVEFAVNAAKEHRNGADLMTHGITLSDPQAGELVFLNLPNRPGGGTDKTAPSAPGRVLTRCEVNLGYSGVGVYWSPGSDENWLSGYEIRRGAGVIDRVCTGTYYFDRSAGWDSDAEYAVRTIDGDGNVSGWTTASATVQEAPVYSTLGGHSGQSGASGWKAEYSHDGSGFAEMTWVPRGSLSPVWADIARQPGGAEGYWQAAETARVGHGWQQASKSAVCVRTWTAPDAGSVRVVGRAIKDVYHQDQGEQLRVRILLNEAQVWPSDGWAAVPQGRGDLENVDSAPAVEVRDNISVPAAIAEDGSGRSELPGLQIGVAHDLTLDVTPGDAVRFVLDKGTTPEHDYLAWMPAISYRHANPRSDDASVVRIVCGASQDYTDSCGNVWSADKYYAGGSAVASGVEVGGCTPGAGDQALYQFGRAGRQFSYSIPVTAGLYSLRLKFAEPVFQMIFERPFNLSINDKTVLSNFDICQSVGGSNKAFEKVFRYLVPDGDGNIVLTFRGGWDPAQQTDEAIVQAIEVLPEIKSAIRIDAGSEVAFIDWSSAVWSGDCGFDGGVCLASDAKVTQASPTLYDQDLYRTARSGNRFSYAVSVTPGLYSVRLKCAELWLKDKGARRMNIDINGRRVREAWDPAEAAGELGMAADFTVEDVAPDKDGKIKIEFTAVGAHDAIVQGIELE